MSAPRPDPGKPVFSSALASTLPRLRRAPVRLGLVLIFWTAGVLTSGLINGPAGHLR
ncbi:hypothetical protein ABIB14_001525 [Arthrobacter sp. UYEF3]